jgi:hypothetical protein
LAQQDKTFGVPPKKEKETEFDLIEMAQRDEPFVPTMGSSQYDMNPEEIEELLHSLNEKYWETKTTEKDQSPKQPKEIKGLAQQDKTFVPIIIGIILFITTIIIAI